MILQHIAREQFTVSQWSGGSTTQIAIYPEGAKYADRDFLWRVSSATVEMEESTFTALPDYSRQIATLCGSIAINHDEGRRLTLHPYEVHAFDGASLTRSWGKCVDFNLMMRKGRCEGQMSAVRVNAVESASVSCEAGETLLIYLTEGAGSIVCTDQKCALSQGEAAIAREYEGEAFLSAESASVFMIVQVRT